MISIDTVVSQIIEMSLARKTGDPVRDIYTVLMDVMAEITKVMKMIREQERETLLNA